MLNWIISIVSFCLLLGGSFPENPKPCRVVTAITIQWEIDDTEYSKVYTAQNKMNKVLNYLRSLEPASQNNSSEDSLMTPQYQILVQRSDGTTEHMVQYGITHFRKEDGSLMWVAPEDAIRLPLLLAAISDDIKF